MVYQKPDHTWGPGTRVYCPNVRERTVFKPLEVPAEPDPDVDTEPQWWRALKGLGMVVGLLTGGLVLFCIFVAVSGQWTGDGGE